MENAEEKYVE